MNSCKINGCDYEGAPGGLRSHVQNKRDDEHDEAAENEAWKDWHPEAYGEEPEQAEETSEQASEEQNTEAETSSDEGGSESSPDDVARQEALVEANAPTESADDEGDDDPDEAPSEGAEEGGGEGSDPSGGGGKALALLAGSLAVGVAALAAAGKSDPEEGGEDPIDVEGEVVETESQGGSESPTPQDAL